MSLNNNEKDKAIDDLLDIICAIKAAVSNDEWDKVKEILGIEDEGKKE